MFKPWQSVYNSLIRFGLNVSVSGVIGGLVHPCLDDLVNDVLYPNSEAGRHICQTYKYFDAKVVSANYAIVGGRTKSPFQIIDVTGRGCLLEAPVLFDLYYWKVLLICQNKNAISVPNLF